MMQYQADLVITVDNSMVVVVLPVSCSQYGLSALFLKVLVINPPGFCR